ncbi:Piso0_004630 [Millerozyma farinosa CBS 7064]|uniref:Piso0_004630 protein n=1 Tax=Pichia sorbitophila (strain ATCC MYA-4447 / BCRC 22081 / CBS 7064 / NBRC 10061 / NRRL Y-12695) TaxID=559304 RepID=G8Y9B4_PICSO|nr:Piso0_004630 [Millerozyma farinosa CBS 7064]CCE85059.1 Piso0_004630 [Millerozyma farinosa CBS 7064]
MYEILCCGSNGNFQLGIGNDEDQNELQKASIMHNGILTNQVESKPMSIRSGGNHTFLLLESGELYSAGDNTYGQCGHPVDKNETHIPVFKKVNHDKKWKAVACGWEFSILVDKDDNFYVCGLGLKGELGSGEGMRNSTLTKTTWTFPSAVESIKASLSHTIIKLEDGSFYGFGSCRRGQLGRVEPLFVGERTRPRASVWWPQKLDFGIDVPLQFSVGRDVTVVIDDKGRCHVFGKEAATRSLDTEVLSLKSMWSSAHILCQNAAGEKKILSFGNNSHGQLFPGDADLNIANFEIGSEHGLLLESKTKVSAWGWGEHGNCGKHKPMPEGVPAGIDQQVTFNYLNPLYNGTHSVVLLGAGCATSWVAISV